MAVLFGKFTISENKIDGNCFCTQYFVYCVRPRCTQDNYLPSVIQVYHVAICTKCATQENLDGLQVVKDKAANWHHNLDLFQ